MAVKLKSWAEVVNEAKNRGEYDYKLDRAFHIGKKALPWGNWVNSDGIDDGDYFVCHKFWVRPYMIAEIENDCCEMSVTDDVLRCGKVITDDIMDGEEYIRIRLIAYNGDLYYHMMVDGDVVECHKVGYPYD